MAYQAGDTILDDEYNTFVTSSSDPFGYNHFAGTGSTVYGLGQTELQAVTGGSTTIAASHWNGLITGMINIANHTNDSLTARTAVAAGSPNATALTTSSALQTVTTASEGWDSTATHEVRATFANGNNARFFFNAGGKLRINVDTVAAATSDKDTAFADLGTAIGNLDIASLATTRSGSGETLTTDGLARGFQDLTTSYQTIIKLTSDNSNYDSNFIEISAKTEGGNGNSGDATAVTIKMVASDAAADTQFQSSNLSSAPVDVKDTPKMRTKLISITPNTDQGLGTAYGLSATSTESNSTS